jgi:hypothetical protein
MNITFDSIKNDVSIGDFIEIKINEQTKSYIVDKIENNTIKSVGGTDGYTVIYIKQS